MPVSGWAGLLRARLPDPLLLGPGAAAAAAGVCNWWVGGWWRLVVAVGGGGWWWRLVAGLVAGLVVVRGGVTWTYGTGACA